MSILFLIIGLLLGGGIIFLIFKNKHTKLEQLDYAEKIQLEKDIELAKFQLDLAREDVDERIEEYREGKLREADAQLAEKLIYFKDEQERIQENLEKIRNETDEERHKILEELERAKASQRAVVDALRKQDEIREQKDFYRLLLTDDELNDIAQLRLLAPRLSRPDLLYKLIWSTYYQNAFNIMAGKVLGEEIHTGIYKITCVGNGKSYIGKSTDIKRRWSEHIKSALEIGSIAKNQLYVGMKDLGIHNFTFEVVEECGKEDLGQREKYYIGFFETNSYGYNMTGAE